VIKVSKVSKKITSYIFRIEEQIYSYSVEIGAVGFSEAMLQNIPP
jgi:hypothetical protein